MLALLSVVDVEILLPEVRAILSPSAYLFESTGKEARSRLPQAPEGLGLDHDSARAIVIQADKDQDLYPLKIARRQKIAQGD